jgi:hypothetical protein
MNTILMKNLRFYILVFTIYILSSCDAPRKNPFDPRNPNSTLRTISGKVQTISPPFLPVSAAQVIWVNGNISSATDANGFFQIETVQNTNGWLSVEKQGYFPYSKFVNWSGAKSFHVDVFLNSLPVADETTLSSSVLFNYPDLQSEQLDVWIRISDRDDDVDSVLISNTYTGFHSELLYNVPMQTYERSFSTFDLSVSRLEELIGHAFQLEVDDPFDHRITVATPNLVRVIREEILFTSPSGNDSTSSRPTLIWKNYDPGFQHSYMLEVFTAEIIPQLVWQSDEVPQDSTEFTVDQDLSAGEYFWVIWAVDEFQNRVRSKPASFRVGP